MAKTKWKQILWEQMHEGAHNNCKLGLGIGVGVFMGIIPVLGCQTLLALVVAHICKLNKPIVVLFSSISIPPVLPFILLASLQLGAFLVTGQWLSIHANQLTWEVCSRFLWYYIIGSLALALACGSLSFLISWYLLNKLRGVPEVRQ